MTIKLKILVLLILMVNVMTFNSFIEPLIHVDLQIQHERISTVQSPLIDGYKGVLYTGQLHNHASSYSDDGTGSVTDNMNYMKNTASPVFNFGGLSGHSHLVTAMPSYWNDVNAATTSTFVGIPGQEWSSLDSSNHVNVYYGKEKCAVANGNIPGFYTWLGTSEGYGTFNHPGYGSDMNNWAYVASADKPGPYSGKMIAMEGLARATGSTTWFSDYVQALSNGWHIGVVVSDDNHDGTPGDKYTNNPRTGMWLTDLNPSNVQLAMQELRFFATQVEGGYIDLQCGLYMMGAVFRGTNGMVLRAKLNPGLTYSSVRIYIDGTYSTMTSAGSGIYEYTVNAGEKHYYFVRAQTSTSGIILSSPMWSDPNAPIQDIYPPMIVGNPSVTPWPTYATVGWTTNETANAYVEWGTSSTVYPNTLKDNMHNSTTHSLLISSLTPSTPYYYRVKSWDYYNNGPVVSNEYNFTTLPHDKYPPMITSGPTITDITDNTATVIFETNETANTYIEWGTTSGVYPDSLLDDSAYDTYHNVVFGPLQASTLYYYRVKTWDIKGNGPTTSNQFTFTTTATPVAEGVYITEINCQPGGVYQREYIELYNSGTTAISIANWQLKQYNAVYTTTFAAGTTIPANGFLIVCRDKATFDSNYSPTYTTYAGSMAMNGGEYFELVDASASIIDKAFSATESTAATSCYERKSLLNDGSLSASWTNLGDTVAGNPGSLGGMVIPEHPSLAYLPLLLVIGSGIMIFSEKRKVL